MEFRDFYSQQAEAEIRRSYRALIDRCDAYMQNHPQSHFWIRDTDHTYNPIRLESSCVPKEDYEDIISTCAKCGSNIHLSFGDEDFGGILICDYCRVQTEEKGLEKVKKLLQYITPQDRQKPFSLLKTVTSFPFFRKKEKHVEPSSLGNIKAIENIEKAKKTKLRVLTNQNTLLYLTLDRIGMDENKELYIIHGDDMSDKVKFAGIYLNERDMHGKRIFQGDILRFNTKDFAGQLRSWEGVITAKRYSMIYHRYHYIIIDNQNNDLPPSPDCIDYNTIEVIGNIFENSEYKIGGCEAKYYDYEIR